MNPLILYSALGSLAIGLATGWVVRDWKADSDYVGAMEKAEKARQRLQDKYDGLALGYEADRSTSDSNSIIRQSELRTIYRDVPTNNNCAAPDAARSLLEDSVAEANARISGQPIGPVSEGTVSPQPAQ